MQVFNQLTPQVYALVKRNQKLRNFLMPCWRFLTSFGVWLRSVFAFSEKTMPPEGFYESTKEWFVTYDSSESEAQYIEIYPSHKIFRSEPKTVDKDIHWKFRTEYQRETPATFVASVPGGRVWGEGNVITPDNKLLADVSKEMFKGEYEKDVKKHSIFNQKNLPPVCKINGTVAVLSAPAGRGYYHWMFDILPRIELLRKSGIDLECVDKFLINSYISRFHMETLAALGITRERVIESCWNPHIKADKLIVPSLPGNTCHMPKWACDFLREEFLANKVLEEKSDGLERIYINRTQVTHRKVTNESEVISYLNKLGFHSVTLESLSVAEQASLLSSAKVVVAPHGAGATNIVFCNPGTKFIHFLSPNSVYTVYWALSNQVGLEYYYLISEGPRPPEYIDPDLNMEDILINIKSLSDIMALANIN